MLVTLVIYLYLKMNTTGNIRHSSGMESMENRKSITILINISSGNKYIHIKKMETTRMIRIYVICKFLSLSMTIRNLAVTSLCDSLVHT